MKKVIGQILELVGKKHPADVPHITAGVSDTEIAESVLAPAIHQGKPALKLALPNYNHIGFQRVGSEVFYFFGYPGCVAYGKAGDLGDQIYSTLQNLLPRYTDKQD